MNIETVPYILTLVLLVLRLSKCYRMLCYMYALYLYFLGLTFRSTSNIAEEFVAMQVDLEIPMLISILKELDVYKGHIDYECN